MAHYDLLYSHDLPNGKAIYTLKRDGVVIQQETMYSLAHEYIITVGDAEDTWSDRPTTKPDRVGDDQAKAAAQEARSIEDAVLLSHIYQWGEKRFVARGS